MAYLLRPQHALPPPSIVLVGDTAPGDPGRDAVLTAVLRALPDSAAATVVSSNAERTARRHGLPAVAATDVRAVLRAVRRAAAVVLTGDTLLGARRGRRGRLTLGHLHALLSIAAYAHATRASVLAVGLATADLDSPVSRGLSREFVRRADLTVFRDDDSARNALEAGAPAPVRVGSDPAWTLVEDVRSSVAHADAGADVVLVLSCVELSDALAGNARRLVADLAAQGLRVRVEDWNRGAQPHHPALRRIASASPTVELGSAPVDLPGAVTRLSGARLVLTGRVHGQIAAAAAGVPSLSLEQESGQRALAERLRQPSQPLAGAPHELLAAARSALCAAPAEEGAMKAETGAAHASLDLLRLMLGAGDVGAAGVDGLRLKGGSW